VTWAFLDTRLTAAGWQTHSGARANMRQRGAETVTVRSRGAPFERLGVPQAVRRLTSSVHPDILMNDN